MTFTPVLAIGLFSQSIFVGGNIAISAIFAPIIRQEYVPERVQAKQFVKLYTDASKLMASSALASAICYAYEAFFSNSGSAAQQALLISGIASISVIPFTLLAIVPTVNRIKKIAKLETDEEIKAQSPGPLIDYWNKLSITRNLIFSVGFVNALIYHIKQ